VVKAVRARVRVLGREIYKRRNRTGKPRGQGVASKGEQRHRENNAEERAAQKGRVA